MPKLFLISYRDLGRPWKTRPYLSSIALRSSQTKQKAQKEAEGAASGYPEAG